MWYLYILLCKNNTLYTGITTDLKRRFINHKNKKAHYTSYNPPLKIIYSEKHETRSSATKREAEIKSWSRKKKLKFLEIEQFL